MNCNCVVKAQRKRAVKINEVHVIISPCMVRPSLVPMPSHPRVCRLQYALVLQATNAGVRRPGNKARLGQVDGFCKQKFCLGVSGCRAVARAMLLWPELGPDLNTSPAMYSCLVPRHLVTRLPAMCMPS